MTAPEPPATPGIALDAEERELIRSLILADPELVLADDMVMRALLGATAKGARNIVDLRDKLVERLEQRLNRLVHANRSVIAAAYENVAGTQQVHRAVLSLIDAPDLGEFLSRLTRDVPAMVGVEQARLWLEADLPRSRPLTGLGRDFGGRVTLVPLGLGARYLAGDGDGETAATVALRPCGAGADALFGPSGLVQSEAVLALTLGEGAGLLAFGAHDPERFGPDQGTDLLTFFGSVAERLLTRHLARSDAPA